MDAKAGSIQLTAMSATGPKLRRIKPDEDDEWSIGDEYSAAGITFRTSAQITSYAPSISNVSSGIFSVIGQTGIQVQAPSFYLGLL